MNIKMVDLQGQYQKIKSEIDQAIQHVIDKANFINGEDVQLFAKNLAAYCGVKHVITCANGTDALQIALMALNLQKGDEIIIPAFTYVATAEVIALLGYTPVMVDVDEKYFNITAELIEKAISPKTKAVVPVHLFGQSCDMEPILSLAQKHNLYVVEDNAQAIGAIYTFSDGKKKQTGAMGHIGCTAFFPSKNLGCYGDGGALFTNDDAIAEKLRMIANHGQEKKYYHKVIGCNSRLDTLQAAILNVKLKYLDHYSQARYNAASYYTEHLKNMDNLITPAEMPRTTHVYHQYTLQIKNGKRDQLKQHLENSGIPAMIYYPLPLQQQEAFKNTAKAGGNLHVAQQLSDTVLSLPMHTELTKEEQDLIINIIKNFYVS